MTDLTAWLLAQIEDDEAAARTAAFETTLPAVWTALFEQSGYSGASTQMAMAHIARHDPARVLADCEAKRKVVELCVAEIDNDTDGASTASSVLYWLTQPYADRPGWDPAWWVET